jgi:hypothetical protein
VRAARCHVTSDLFHRTEAEADRGRPAVTPPRG